MISVKDKDLQAVIDYLADVSNRTRLLDTFLKEVGRDVMEDKALKAVLMSAGGVDATKSYLDFSEKSQLITFTSVAKISAGSGFVDTRSQKAVSQSRLSNNSKSSTMSNKSVAVGSNFSDKHMKMFGDITQEQLSEYLFIKS